ncbi:MAG: hypothetical protein V7767_11490 [Leeuwenhoekiella sp.]
MGNCRSSIFKPVIMGVTISPSVQADTYWVNGKEVYKDTDGQWTCAFELSQVEKEAFQQYIKG